MLIQYWKHVSVQTNDNSNSLWTGNNKQAKTWHISPVILSFMARPVNLWITNAETPAKLLHAKFTRSLEQIGMKFNNKRVAVGISLL